MRKTIIIISFIFIMAAISAAALMASQFRMDAGEEPPPKPVTVAVGKGEVTHTVTAPGQLVGTEERILGVDLDGRLIELSVRPGSRVKTGDVIARIDPTPYENALAMAEIDLEEAQAAYQQQLAEAELAVAAGEAQVESTQAQIPSLAAAEINLQAARDRESRAAYEYQKAQDRTWEPPEVVEAYRLEWESTVRDVALSEAEVNRIQAQQWSVSQQVNALSSNVAQSDLQAQFLAESGLDPRLTLAVEEAEKNLDKTIIEAPFDGVVLQVFAHPGQQLPAGVDLAMLTDPDQGEVRTTVIEEDLSLVTIGQQAEIYFDARPDVLVGGEVSRIVPQRVEGEARPLYYVFLSLNDPLPEGVFPGMTADASLLIDRAEDVLRLPRALVAARSDDTATVEIWQDGQIVSREIELGLRGDVFTTITDGLAEGDEVIGE